MMHLDATARAETYRLAEMQQGDIKSQIDALLKGFVSILDGSTLVIFEMVVVGSTLNENNGNR